MFVSKNGTEFRVLTSSVHAAAGAATHADGVSPGRVSSKHLSSAIRKQQGNNNDQSQQHQVTSSNKTTRLILVAEEEQSRQKTQEMQAAEQLAMANQICASVMTMHHRLHPRTGKDASASRHLDKHRKHEKPAAPPETPWEQITSDAFDNAQATQYAKYVNTYTPTGVQWLPQEAVRDVHEHWKTFYRRWKTSPNVTSSSLLASFFCSMLIDDTLDTEMSISLNAYITNETLEITNDAETDAVDACSFATMSHFIVNLASFLFPTKQPLQASQLLCSVMVDRTHRVDG